VVETVRRDPEATADSGSLKMRAILEDLRTGEISTRDIPAPELRERSILVRTAYSAISAGTEQAKIETSKKSLLGKAISRPDIVTRVVDFARNNGIKAAYNKVQSRLETLSPMGYSCSGLVIGVGEGVTEFQIGDRVACAGAGHANHSEINCVPSNLAVKIPDAVSLDSACLTTIGAIAVQGLRQSRAVLGETVIIIGVGLVGVLTIKLARAAGCRVIAIDQNEARVAGAGVFGAELSLISSAPNLAAMVRQFSRYGADVAIITAATKSAEPLELAAELSRDRARIVVVGDVGMNISRRDMYQKELELVMSRSYGPGRYDPSYEDSGHDYPIGYVRWTEKRNMEAFLDLIASGALSVSPLLEHGYPVNHAERAYAELNSKNRYTAIIHYPEVQVVVPKPRLRTATAVHRGANEDIRVGCIGAGTFARDLIFPNLKAAGAKLEAVGSASGISAETARAKFGFARAQTPSEVLADPDLDAVFIATPHRSHAQYVIDGIQKGKAVFVEKPLAINREQLLSIVAAYVESSQRGPQAFLTVGFNRRFAPASHKIRDFFSDRQEPMMVHVRVNAGVVSGEHWLQQAGEGGRIVGELCHFLDWARFITGNEIKSVTASALPDGSRYHRDNVAVVLNFADGSVGNLLYLANGDSAVPKEFYEVFCAGSVARMENFRTLELARNGKVRRLKLRQDKGHRNEFDMTLERMRSGKEAPIPFAELVEVTNATFCVIEALSTGSAVIVENVHTYPVEVSTAAV
jgi:predicted dehydrogenase/threonine dehydrogenase-like Zn-dependent dehydrogenase